MVRLKIVVVAAFLITGTMGTLAVKLPPGAAIPRQALTAQTAGPMHPPTNANYMSHPTALAAQAAQAPQPAHTQANNAAYIQTPPAVPASSMLMNAQANAQQRPGVIPQLPRPYLHSLPTLMPRPPSRPPRPRVSPAKKLLDFIGQIRAALDLECKTVRDILGLELPRFIPITCDGKCLPPTVCRNVGQVGFCCPFFVTDQVIQAYGVLETYKLLG